MALYGVEPESETSMGTIPDYASMLDAWNNGTLNLARMDTKDYVPFPKEKEDWNQTQAPQKEMGMRERITEGIQKGFREWNSGYYKGKVPEELK